MYIFSVIVHDDAYKGYAVGHMVTSAGESMAVVQHFYEVLKKATFGDAAWAPQWIMSDDNEVFHKVNK